MNVDSWWIERLSTTQGQYALLKQAGLETIGQLKKLLQDGAGRLEEATGLSSDEAKRLNEQIQSLEEGESVELPVAQPAARPTARAVVARPTPAAGESAPTAQADAPREQPQTLEDLEMWPRETITPEIAARIIGCAPQTIRSQAQVDAGALGFPVILMGCEVKIPRRGFIHFMEYGRSVVQKRSERK